ncbi:SPFH domain-containing protein [Bifidobacterium dentium]|uniref:SPFH domain-containing protein n=1 Tax=Bifidobacterium dentium TaxID=1689 RepID=UPI0018B05E05|nr:SPFH domain-containing protein [Bifidobacterium dentium]MBF9688088.1 SPFH domain-containing protein [Bifidobacterium dentium]
MGLLKAGVGAAGGVLADQWREYFYCEALDADTLVAKGEKRVGKRGSNTKGENNVISDGSIVAVADGQCMMIVENGAVVDVCAEPGEFVYDTGTEPSVFSGKLGDMVKKSFEQVGRRFTFGGDAGKDQRIYYFNTKEIVGNKYGTASPVPFRVVDEKIGLDVDITVRCNGEYSYKLVDPLMFYKNVCGNVESAYTRDLIDSQLKSELLTALQPAFARISEMGIRYSAVPAHTRELADALNEELSHEWKERRGIEIAAFGVNTISAPEDQEQMIRDLQKAAVMANPAMAAANIASAQSDAMRTAAANPAGAAMGFMGMGMASGMGGMNATQLFGQASQAQQAPAQAQPVGAAGAVAAGTGTAAAGAAWTCSCGAQNTGKFCGNCGSPKPEAAGPWFCTNCGTQNTGNFCSGCGSKRP